MVSRLSPPKSANIHDLVCPFRQPDIEASDLTQVAANPQKRAADQSVVARVGAGITKLRNFVFNTLFILLLMLLTVGLIASCETVSVPKNSALIVNPKGQLVEAQSVPNPLQDLISQGGNTTESELGPVLRAINLAATDDDISMVVLDLDQLVGVTPAQAQQVGAALTQFRTSGKKVVAFGYLFSQGQYYIASFANAVYMHPMGQLMLPGFGSNTLYFRDLFDKFGVNVHVFRVGDYKAAVEPFTRSDMSEDARLANETLYQNLWQHLVDDIATNRKLEREAVLSYANNFPAKLRKTGGDLARAALESNLVDELLTADQARRRFGEEVGFVKGEVNGIDYQSYLQARGDTLNLTGDRIGVIVVQGTILSGADTGGVASSDALTRLIRQAKEDDAIKALVVRIDSPGGSSFASELIRSELELVQVAGKPVVASFASTAASGGYWIAATSDSIIAEPTTITGSIGIFSLITTFEKGLAEYGVHSDGVGTTPLSSGYDSFTGVGEAMAQVLQSSVEHGYHQFTDLVARGRNMSRAEVEQIAQGRVWTGEDALELGLVDELGSLQAALTKAAELAEIEDWTVDQLRSPIDPRDLFLAELLQSDYATSRIPEPNSLVMDVQHALGWFSRLSDRKSLYALCMSCVSVGF